MTEPEGRPEGVLNHVGVRSTWAAMSPGKSLCTGILVMNLGILHPPAAPPLLREILGVLQLLSHL